MKPKPFPQIEGKTIARAMIEAVDDLEYKLVLTFTDGYKLVVEPGVPEESNLDIWLMYGPR